MKITSRTEAKQLGLTHYFTGKPCKHGHVAHRRVSRGDCIECIKRTDKQSYERNRNNRLNKQKIYYSNNTEKVKQYQQQYRADHKEELNERHRDRYKTTRFIRCVSE